MIIIFFIKSNLRSDFTRLKVSAKINIIYKLDIYKNKILVESNESYSNRAISAHL